MSNNSIEITGQQNYDFQDMVCVYLILILLSKYPESNNSFFAEQADSEDATMIIDGRTIEVQVKGSTEPLTLKGLADYLSHFPDRSSDNPLFERLLSDNRLVIFIVSARCRDDVFSYVTNFDQGFIEHSRDFRKKDVTDIYDEFSNWSTGKDTSLMIERDSTIQALPEKSKETTKEALKRILVLEQFTNDKAKIECTQLLRSKFNIPNHKHTKLINELVTIVKEGKRQDSILDECKVAILKLQSNTVRPKNYIENGNEDEFYNVLCEKNVLVITGEARVGKTYTARFLASEFQIEGYEIEVLNDVNEAELLLRQPYNLVILLDDPLGSITANNNAHQNLTTLRKILNSASTHKKVIISQREDILLEVSNSSILNELRFNHHLCYKLIVNIDFSVLLWNKLASEYNVPDDMSAKISEYLTSSKLVLQAGCIEHLAVNHDKVVDNLRSSDIESVAYQTASDLSRELKSQGFGSILQALYLTTDLNVPVELEHFKHIIHTDDENILAISNQIGKSLSFGVLEKKDHPNEIFHSYKELKSLSDEEENYIDSMIKKRIIDYDENNSYKRIQVKFSHPFYQHSAELLFNNITPLSFNRILPILKQAIFCLSPSTSRVAANKISKLYRVIREQSSKIHLIELAIESLNSSYPATRDVCFEFLIENFESFSDEIDIDIPKWIGKVSFFSLDDVAWSDGKPVYPMTGSLSIESGYFYSDNILKPNFNNPFVNDQLVTTKDAWIFLGNIKKTPSQLTNKIMDQLLGFEEGLLRAQATEVWLSIERSDDEKVLDYIFNDNHPSVSQAIIQIVYDNWSEYSKERKRKITEGLKIASDKKINSIVMLEKIIKIFSKDEFFLRKEEKPIALLELFPLFIDKVPERYITLHSISLYSSILENKDALSEHTLMSIFYSWIGWLERKTKLKLPDDYELGITSLITTIEPSQDRYSIIERLLSLHGTGAKVRVIYDLVEEWDRLSEIEKLLLIKTINSSGIDKNWLISSALVQNIIPDDILVKFMPEGISVGSISKLQDINYNLFECVIKTYLGYQPLWYLGVHHRGYKYWQSSLEAIAINPQSLLFKDVWHDYFAFKSSEEEYLISVIKKLDNNHLDELFNIYLEYLIENNAMFLSNLVNFLFDSAPSASIRSTWLKRIAQNANQIFDRWSDVNLLITNNELKKELFDYLKSDMDILKISYEFKKIKDGSVIDAGDENIEYMINISKRMFINTPPIHYYTCLVFSERMKSLGADEEFLLEIENRRVELIKESHSSSFSESHLAESDNWIS